ncbi:MFS transporter [Streptococcus thoraltensis]|uniref:MFS transporter n=1 Tax=Streptococcus thoraltensis TaxID=55085 RepID=UPI00037A48F1|nr:MFS transporter [Streptococcus thoraltensis]MDY4761814.1 MFS transporter [Streptococcus thoraltensis]
MKSTLERASLLSLSLMMVSTFAVSPALPQMIAHFEQEGFTASQIERLIPLSSFAIIAILLLTPVINRFLKERAVIVLGLLFLSIGGSLPVLFQAYPLIFLSRILLGSGIGLLNARAINIISERFTGDDRTRMLGLRGSMEVLGSALLTFLAGQLLSISWSASFSIYGLGLIILFMYMAFVPDIPHKQESTKKLEKTAKFSQRQLLYSLAIALYAGFIILVNSSVTIRIPQVVEQLGLGTASQSSILLSAMMIMGILAGTLYSPLMAFFGKFFQASVTLIFGLGCLILWLADSWLLLSIGALTTGFFYSLAVTYAFHIISEKMPAHLLSTATVLVLLGCNLGGGSTAFALQLLTNFAPAPTAVFGLYSLLILSMTAVLIAALLFSKKKKIDRTSGI